MRLDAGLARALQRSRTGEPLDDVDVLAVLRCPDEHLADVLERARELRDEGLAARGRPGVVTYSRKVFIPLTYLCRYRCSYCTFVTPRATPGLEYLTTEQVLEIASAGREWGCTEALFTLGESPELRHPEARGWLTERGFASTVDYLVHCAGRVVADTGLLPHANPGAVTAEEMLRIRDVSASQGVMMEQLTDRLLRPGEAHAGAPGKAEATRLEQIALAHRTAAPFTTGFLIGIGETLAERAATIVKIRDAAHASGGPHPGTAVQEVIVQNFRAKPDTPMRGSREPDESEMVRAIAATRLAFGPLASIQAPPNLTPRTYGGYLDAGIDDWGGISPVTPDHVNPEMPWPRISEVAEVCAGKGLTLRQRLPVYPEYLRPEAFEHWVAPSMRRHVLAVADATGLAREERWHAGEGWVPALRAAQPRPKRRALAIAEGKPDLKADEVFGQAQTAGCGDASGVATTGFDEMLPDLPSRTVMPWERADLTDRNGSGAHRWVAPYIGRSGTPSPEVREICDRGQLGERLAEADVERLLHSEGPDLEAVLEKADEIRREVCGDEVSYVVNRNITYTNFCHTGCGFCGFARPLGHDDGYYFDPAEVGRRTREAWELGATEVCIQGGIHPGNDGRIYLDIARAVKDAAPEIHLHGFSPLEITVGAKTLGLPLDRYLPMLAEAGVDSIPGTAAEILDDRVRPQLTPEKLSAADWLELMRTAHRIGLPSTSTIMFGHIDDPGVWAQHILRLRDLQAETGGFTEFIPLPFVHHRSPIFMRGGSRTGPTWRESLKLHAVARIALHPLFRNIQASWVKLGAEGVVAHLEVGCNDFGGTLMEEHISRMAGASHGLGLAVEAIEEAIRRAGRVPVERTTTYGRPRRKFSERVAQAV